MEMFTQRLIGGRNRKGLTQTELAKELGVHLRSIQNWEGGLTEPRGKVLRNLSEVLGMSVAFLLGMDDGGAGKSARYLKDSKGGEVRQKAHEYLDKVLDGKKGDEDMESWVYVELKKKFPLAGSAGDAEPVSGGAGSRRGRSSRPRGSGRRP